jgi:hypothetical protein
MLEPKKTSRKITPVRPLCGSKTKTAQNNSHRAGLTPRKVRPDSRSAGEEINTGKWGNQLGTYVRSSSYLTYLIIEIEI